MSNESKLIIFALTVISIQFNIRILSVTEDNRQMLAAIIDNGCNTHIDIPAQSEYREYNEGNL